MYMKAESLRGRAGPRFCGFTVNQGTWWPNTLAEVIRSLEVERRSKQIAALE